MFEEGGGMSVVYSLRSENTRISKLTQGLSAGDHAKNACGSSRVPESFEEYLLLTDEQKFELWKREKGAGE